MKMKSVMASLMLATSLNASAELLTFSPIYAALAIGEAVTYAAVTTLAPSAITSAKEQMAVVRHDAINFLAGEEATEVLVLTMNELRKDKVFSDLTDEDLATLIIETIE